MNLHNNNNNNNNWIYFDTFVVISIVINLSTSQDLVTENERNLTGVPRILVHPEPFYFVTKSVPYVWISCLAEPVSHANIICGNNKTFSYMSQRISNSGLLVRQVDVNGNEIDTGLRWNISLKITRSQVIEWFGPLKCRCEIWNKVLALGRAKKVYSKYSVIMESYFKQHFKKIPLSQKVKIGETVALTCDPPDAVPRPQISWSKDDKFIVESDYPEISVSLDGEELIINKMNFLHEGRYCCLAKSLNIIRKSPCADITISKVFYWSQWGPCDIHCVKSRTRYCENRECPYEQIQQKNCTISECSQNNSGLMKLENIIYVVLFVSVSGLFFLLLTLVLCFHKKSANSSQTANKTPNKHAEGGGTSKQPRSGTPSSNGLIDNNNQYPFYSTPPPPPPPLPPPAPPPLGSSSVPPSSTTSNSNNNNNNLRKVSSGDIFENLIPLPMSDQQAPPVHLSSSNSPTDASGTGRYSSSSPAEGRHILSRGDSGGNSSHLSYIITDAHSSPLPFMETGGVIGGGGGVAGGGGVYNSNSSGCSSTGGGGGGGGGCPTHTISRTGTTMMQSSSCSPATTYKSGRYNNTNVFYDEQMNVGMRDTVIWGNITCEGGRLTLPESGISLFIPSGSIPPGISQKIFLSVSRGYDQGPPLDDGNAQLSPVIICGPRFIEFSKFVILSIPHNAVSTRKQWRLKLMSCKFQNNTDTLNWKTELVTDLADPHREMDNENGNATIVHLHEQFAFVLTRRLDMFCLLGRTSPYSVGGTRCSLSIRVAIFTNGGHLYGCYPTTTTTTTTTASATATDILSNNSGSINSHKNKNKNKNNNNNNNNINSNTIASSTVHQFHNNSSFASNDGIYLRCYVIPDTREAFWNILTAEQRVGGRLLKLSYAVWFAENGENLVMRINDVAPGWTVHQQQLYRQYQTLEFQNIWRSHGNLGVNSNVRMFQFEPNGNNATVAMTNNFSCNLVVYQNGYYSSRVELELVIATHRVLSSGSASSLNPPSSELSVPMTTGIQRNGCNGNSSDFDTQLIPLKVKAQLAQLLNKYEPSSNDWRLLARELHIDNTDLLVQENPAELLLDLYQAQNNHPYLMRELKTIFLRHQRFDCAALLDSVRSSPFTDKLNCVPTVSA